MSYSFFCKGHENISALHKTTLEFTKDDYLTPTGDCIIGISADFDHKALLDFLLDKKQVSITLQIKGVSQKIRGVINPEFSDPKEIVVRKTSFLSNRTLATNASSAAIDIKREIIQALKDPCAVLEVSIDEEENIKQ